MRRLSWVRGNSVLMTVTLIQKNTDGTETPIDLSTYDSWAANVWFLSSYKRIEEDVRAALDQQGRVVLSIPATLPCGMYSVEVLCSKAQTGGGIAKRRSYELPVFQIVESNGEARTTYDIVQGQISADIDMTFQLVPIAETIGKNAYEMWKELPGHEDKTLQDYIDEVLDLNGITAACVEATEDAQEAAIIGSHPDYIGEDNYVYHWTNGEYVKTDIYCKGDKGDPGSGGGGVQADWSQSDNTEPDYIKNKPTIPDAQIQSDWNQSSTTAKDYIKNKPTIPDISGKADKATTLAGYGITDAKIVSGTITLGGNTITPLTSYTETDPTVPSWAKASSKPTYTASEVGALPDSTVIPDVTGKADKVTSATNGNFAALDSNGNLTDSGHKHGDYLTSHQDISNYVQKSSTAGLLKNDGTVDTSTYLTSAHEVPSGGNAGQILAKTSATDYDVHWTNQTITYPSAYCTTAAGTAAKKASCSLYALQTNSYVHILMGGSNTSASALTLSINSSTAKPIYINGTASSATNYTLPAGTYIVFYDGTNFYFRTDGKIQGLSGTLVCTNSTSGLLKNDGSVDTSTYLTSHQDISGKEDKVSVGTISGTSLSASIGTYYVGSSVGTLAVTLPTISDATHIASVVLNIATGSSPSVTFTAASGVTISYSKDFSIDASTEYEVNCLWQGTKWIIMAMEVETPS